MADPSHRAPRHRRAAPTGHSEHESGAPPRLRRLALHAAVVVTAVVVGLTVAATLLGQRPPDDEVSATISGFVATSPRARQTGDPARPTGPGSSAPALTGPTASDPAGSARPVVPIRYQVQRPARPLELKPVPVDVDYGFDVATLNVLGSNHTRHSKQWAPGVVRTRTAAGVLRSRGADVMGFQEVQADQLGVLHAQLGGYTIWPSSALGGNGLRLQIAWRSDLFELVASGTITTEFSTQRRPIPWVKLRSRETGGEFYFLTVHNSPRSLEAERDRATASEIVLLRQLLSTGLPVLVVGDMNEKEEFFCRVGAATGMVAANGGRAGGGCVLPPPPTGLDWIMGGNVTGFSGYVRQHVGRISDHPVVTAHVTLTTTVLRKPAP